MQSDEFVRAAGSLDDGAVLRHGEGSPWRFSTPVARLHCCSLLHSCRRSSQAALLPPHPERTIARGTTPARMVTTTACGAPIASTGMGGSDALNRAAPPLHPQALDRRGRNVRRQASSASVRPWGRNRAESQLQSLVRTSQAWEQSTLEPIAL